MVASFVAEANEVLVPFLVNTRKKYFVLAVKPVTLVVVPVTSFLLKPVTVVANVLTVDTSSKYLSAPVTALHVVVKPVAVIAEASLSVGAATGAGCASSSLQLATVNNVAHTKTNVAK